MYQWHLSERLSERELKAQSRRRTRGYRKLLRVQQRIEIAFKLRATARQVRHKNTDPRFGISFEPASYPCRACCCLVRLALRGIEGRADDVFHAPRQCLLCAATPLDGHVQRLFGRSCAVEPEPPDLAWRCQRAEAQRI